MISPAPKAHNSHLIKCTNEGPHARMEICLLQMGPLSRQREGLCARCQVLLVLDPSRSLILSKRARMEFQTALKARNQSSTNQPTFPGGLVHPICKPQDSLWPERAAHENTCQYLITMSPLRGSHSQPWPVVKHQRG